MREWWKRMEPGVAGVDQGMDGDTRDKSVALRANEGADVEIGAPRMPLHGILRCYGGLALNLRLSVVRRGGQIGDGGSG